MKKNTFYNFKRRNKLSPYAHKDLAVQRKIEKKFNTRLENLIAKYPNHFNKVELVNDNGRVTINRTNTFELDYVKPIGLQLAQIYDYVRSISLDTYKRHEDIKLTKRYYGNEVEYPKYDNYDGININKTQDIPLDYDGYMGVPITFLHKFNPDHRPWWAKN